MVPILETARPWVVPKSQSLLPSDVLPGPYLYAAIFLCSLYQ